MDTLNDRLVVFKYVTHGVARPVSYLGAPELLSRSKIVLFHVMMWALIALPISVGAILLITSIIGYDILQHPELHQGTGRVWNVIATDLYYLYEADIWQNKKDCVQYDDKLLYKPSSGCSFSNKEFSTNLTFSDAGRSVPFSRSPSSGQPLFFAGDSDTMGWGVNDDETFTSIIASRVEVPVLNLGVSSYGTVREIIRTRNHPHFQAASCIFIQYSWNDFQENSVFLARGGLPAPTPARFEKLVSDYGRRKVRFLDVMRQTFDIMVDYPIEFFLNVFGLHDFPLLDDDPLDSKSGAPREETEDVKAFLAVLSSFSELNDKKVFVIGPGRFVSALARRTLAANVFPIQVDLNYGDWYTLDRHPNKKGHREIAMQILEQLKRTEQGRHCVAAEF
jgi:lysophospholipase L1-like esterase